MWKQLIAATLFAGGLMTAVPCHAGDVEIDMATAGCSRTDQEMETIDLYGMKIQKTTTTYQCPGGTNFFGIINGTGLIVIVIDFKTPTSWERRVGSVSDNIRPHLWNEAGFNSLRVKWYIANGNGAGPNPSDPPPIVTLHQDDELQDCLFSEMDICSAPTLQ
jgi:hypothetical protein